MGNCFCFSSHQGEVCSEKLAMMINPVKISSPFLETDTHSGTSPDYKRHMGDEDAMNGGIKRIRLVVTKQELRELLSKRKSVEEMLAEVHREGRYRVEFVRKWQPLLETIPEEVSSS